MRVPAVLASWVNSKMTERQKLIFAGSLSELNTSIRLIMDSIEKITFR